VIHCVGSNPARKSSILSRFCKVSLRWGGLFVVLIMVGVAVAPAQALAKYAAIVINAANGRVLYENNADVRNYPASLTKMMTLYLLFDALESKKVSMGSQMKVSAHAAGQAPSKLGLRAGSSISVENAIKALVTKSANDVAVVIAEFLGGSESKFATLMTNRARALGMSRTTFRNASGLPDNGQMSTARDMATLSLALQNNHREYYHFFSLRSFSLNGQVYGTHNRVLLNYAGADGLKTGYIRASGFNLAASAKRDGVRLVGVVFGGKTSRWRDDHMMSLLDRGFSSASLSASASAAESSAPPLPVAKPADATTSTFVAAPVPEAPVVPLSKPQSLSGLNLSVPQALPEVSEGTSPLSVGLKRSWGVQVGAFSQIESARKQADTAAAMLRKKASAVQSVVTSVTSGRSLIYRSRVLGLSNETAARNACDDLRRKRLHCVVIKPGSMDMAFLPPAGKNSFDAR
jgi:D-alanyl-D-alanine carboxypeptidase